MDVIDEFLVSDEMDIDECAPENVTLALPDLDSFAAELATKLHVICEDYDSDCGVMIDI